MVSLLPAFVAGLIPIPEPPYNARVAILVQSQSFKGSLTDLIDQPLAQAIDGNPPPMGGIWVEGPEASRCFWGDRATDEDTGQEFRIWYILRSRNNRVWAVGIRADHYLFPINTDDPQHPYFEVYPKGNQYNQAMVTWVTRGPDGNLQNHGVGV